MYQQYIQRLFQCSRCKRLLSRNIAGRPKDWVPTCCPKGEVKDVTEEYEQKLRKRREEIERNIQARRLAEEKAREKNR